MGYAALIASDDFALRHAVQNDDSARATLEDLAFVLGTESYPIGGTEAVTAGPWTRFATLHASEVANIEVHASGAAVVEDFHDSDAPWSWVPSREQTPWHPGKPVPAPAPVAPPRTGLTSTSVWVAYADYFPVTWESEDLGTLRELTSRHVFEMLSLGRGCVFRIGGVLNLHPGWACRLEWSNNTVRRSGARTGS